MSDVVCECHVTWCMELMDTLDSLTWHYVIGDIYIGWRNGKDWETIVIDRFGGQYYTTVDLGELRPWGTTFMLKYGNDVMTFNSNLHGYSELYSQTRRCVLSKPFKFPHYVYGVPGAVLCADDDGVVVRCVNYLVRIDMALIFKTGCIFSL